MKVRLKVNRVADGHRQPRGSVIEVSPAEGRVLISSRRAEAVDESKGKPKESGK